MKPGDPADTTLTRVVLAAILAVVWLLFLPALDFGFLALDDQYGVATNPGIRDLSWRGIRFLFLEDQRDWRWFPLSYLSFAVDHALFDLAPRAVHRTNLMLHAANTALVFALVRSLTRDSLAAGAAALLFGVHPLQVESVAWVSSRKTLLFLFFFLLAVEAYLPFARAEDRRSPRALAALGASVSCFLLSMMAKPTGVTLPAVLLLVDVAVAPAPPARPIAFALRRLPSKLVYVPVIAFVAWMTSRVSRPSPFGAEVSFGVFEWIVLVASNLSFYVAKALVPIHLGVFYPLPNDGVPGLPWHFHALALLGVALVVLCVASYGRWRWVFFGTAWYLVTLLPSAVQPAFLHDPPVLAADRYFYQSSIGLFLVAGVGASALWRHLDDRSARAAVAGLAVGVVAILLGLARQHVLVFRDAIPLYEQTLRHHPSDAFYHRLAIEYADVGRTSSAFHALELAERAPNRVFFGNLFGYQMRLSDLYRRKGEPAKAAAFLARALDATPNAIEPASVKTPLAFRYLASLWEEAGDFPRAAAARAAAETAAVDASHYFESNWLVMAPEAAIGFLERRVAEAPGDAVAWYYLGRGLELHQQHERAIECLVRAKQLGFPRVTFRSAALLALLLAIAPLAEADDPVSPAWKRGEIVTLEDEACHELRIERVGAGLLEVRFFDGALPLPVGADPKTSGASLLIPTDDSERASFLLYDASGLYAQSAQLPAPIRWMRRGRDLCVSSGANPIFCGRTRTGIEWTTRIAFGAGWQTSVSGCTPLPMRARPLGTWLAALAGFLVLAGVAFRHAQSRWQRLGIPLLAIAFGAIVLVAHDPWRLPFAAIVAVGAVGSCCAAIGATRGRSWLAFVLPIGLASIVVLALARVPHPAWTEAPATPKVPPLWLDTASWQPLAAHQSLRFRERPVASLAPQQPNWLVLGGSVVFGDGVEAHQAFPAVAQDLLRAQGSRTEIFNAGVQGWNIHNVDRFLADVGGELPVTGIAIASILNNATLPIAVPTAAGCDASLLRASWCNVSRNQLTFTWPKVFLPKPHNPARYRDALRRILTRELARGRQVVLLDEIGEIDEGMRIWNTETYREIARSVGAELGVPLRSVSEAIASLPPEDRYLDGIHPTPAMHALLGKRLAEILREP